MGPRIRSCCVPKCNDKTSKRYAIPMNEECRSIWLERINNEKLFLDISSLKSFKVCASHFDPVCFEMGNERLKRNSLPTLNLPGYNKQEGDNFFVSPGPCVKATPEKIKEILLSPTATKLGDSPVAPVNKPKKTYIKRKLDFSSENVYISGPSMSSSELVMETEETICLPSTSRVSRQDLKWQKKAVQKSATKEVSVRKSPILTSVRRYIKPPMTENEKTLFKKIAKLRKVAWRARNLNARMKMEFLHKNQAVLTTLKSVNDITLNFFMSQQKTQKLKPRGRRFTMDDKIFALSLFKQSGKSYRFLSKIFSLPSYKTLQKLLQQIPFYCGINSKIFDHLQGMVGKLKILDRYCVLMFDEISLNPGLSYNPARDCVDGLVDLGGSERKAAFADHALVFMLRGIHLRWKQPLCFYFCEHSTPTTDLIRILKDVVRHVRKTNLQLVATVCDQGATNVAAIKQLLLDTNSYCVKNNVENKFQGYLVDGQEVIHFFDYPHLLKGVRNGLLTRDLHFYQEGQHKVASWSHIVDVYKADQKMGAFSQFPKLSDQHVFAEKIKKMKVKNCTQVFSRTVATAMKVRAEMSKELNVNSNFYVNPLASQTADLLLFFDELFDSVNGNSLVSSPGKELRTVVTSTSKHIEIWKHSINILQTMYFLSPPSQRIVTPSIKNWIFTIRSFLYAWQILKSKGFRYIAPKCFNQDPLENFFSLVRSHGVRNTNPTCSSFISSNKTLVINNLLSLHSPSSNCEQDETSGLLDTLKELILLPSSEEILSNVCAPVYPYSEVQSSGEEIGLATSYVAGFVIKKFLKVTKCRECANILNSTEDLPENILIKRRQYVGAALCFPSKNFLELFGDVSKKIFNFIPLIINSFNIKQKLKENIDISEIRGHFCENHRSNTELFKNIIVNVVLYHYINIVNKLLNGKDLRYKNFDVFTKMAFEKHLKKRKNK